LEGAAAPTPLPPEALDRRELARRTLAVLGRGGRRNPDVLLVDLGERRVVVKDFAPRGPLVRALLARWLVEREARAYARLAGHPNVPRLLARPDALALVFEHRPGRRLSRRLASSLPPDFLDRLEAAVAAMHERGVAHLDLRHRSNVLVDAGGDPVLIDFASAMCRSPDGGRLVGALWRALARLDRAALAKWRSRLQPSPPLDAAGGGGADASEARRGASRPT
jgi:hypothetical protein